MEKEKKWYCNAYPDRVEVLKDEKLGQAVALHHADCTELIPTGELGEFQHDGSEKMRQDFEKQGIVGIYRSDGVGPRRT